MMTHSVARYPLPPGQAAGPNRRLVLTAALFLPVAVCVSAYLAVTELNAGHYVSSIISTGFAISLVGIGWAIVSADRRSRLEVPDLSAVECRDNSTVLGCSKRFMLAGAAIFFLLSASLVLAGVAKWIGWSSLPMTSGGAILYPPIMLAVGSAGVALVLWGSVRTRKPMVRLSPTSLSVRKEIWGSIEHSWDAIADVSLPRSGASNERRGYVEEVRKNLPPYLIRADRLSLGLPATYWLLDFYIDRPELRDELADGRAIGRLRDGSVITQRGWISCTDRGH